MGGGFGCWSTTFKDDRPYKFSNLYVSETVKKRDSQEARPGQCRGSALTLHKEFAEPIVKDFTQGRVDSIYDQWPDLQAWGYNSDGLLGDETMQSRRSPVKVPSKGREAKEDRQGDIAL